MAKKRDFKTLRKITVGILGASLVLFGLALIIYSSMVSNLPSIQKAVADIFLAEQQEPKETANNPVKIYIPKLSRTLYITEGEVVDNRWIISQTGVSHLKTSAIPGDAGNSVIYGHNLDTILGGLPYMATGDVIYIVLKDGNFVKYEIEKTAQVEPSQVEILKNTQEAKLTIFTCDGFLDQARFVVVAKQVNNS